MTKLDLQALLLWMCRSVVNSPDRLVLEVDENDYEIHYIVHTQSGEEGQIVGKNGSLLNSIRAVLRAAGRCSGAKLLFVDLARGNVGVSTNETNEPAKTPHS